MASPNIRHLARLWRSVPLKGLQQGSTLTIRSNLPGPTHVVLKPEWRDNGHADLKQVFSKGSTSKEINLVVQQEEDHMTSMGRMASHVTLLLEEQIPTEQATPVHGDSSKEHVIHHTTVKPTDKVMLDDGTIVPDSDEFSPPPKGTKRVEYPDGVAHVTQVDAAGEHDESGTFLTVQMPEKVNVTCELSQGGTITIAGKVEGDVKLFTADGDMSVTKLRGHRVELKSGGANSLIYIKDLVEAQKVSLQTSGRVRAKQIHGTQVDVNVVQASDATGPRESQPVALDADDEGSLVDIGSIYIAGNGGATIQVGGCQPDRRAVRVKSNHGPLRVETKGVGVPTEINQATEEIYPVVELGGVNGNCEVSIESLGSADSSAVRDWSSCLVHVDSLSPDSVSLITVDQGDVSVTFDRKVEADLRLLSTTCGAESLGDFGTTIAEEEDPEVVTDILGKVAGEVSGIAVDQRISIQTKAFSSRSSALLTSNSLEYVDGWVENKSAEPDSRFERKTRGDTGSVGKIRLTGAADLALHGFSSPDGNGTEVGYLRPLFAVVGTSRIVVETVSWLGAIARRYGLVERDRELGRTASRRGRPLVSKNE